MERDLLNNQISPAVAIDAVGFAIQEIQRGPLMTPAAKVAQVWTAKKLRPIWPPVYRPLVETLWVVARMEQRVRVVLLFPHRGLRLKSAQQTLDSMGLGTVALIHVGTAADLAVPARVHNVQWVYSSYIDGNSPELSGKIPVYPFRSLRQLQEDLQTHGVVESWKNLVVMPRFGVPK